MAQIQRKRHFEDTLELLDEQGNICVTLPVSLNIEQIYTKLQSARRRAAEAEENMRRQQTEESMQAYGQSVCLLFASVFGEDGCEKIVRHYENNYTEMMIDIMPYLLENIFPRIDELSKARIEQAVKLRAAVDSYAGKHSRGRQRKRWRK